MWESSPPSSCFPFVFTGLLNFVGIYGLLLVPAGAIVITEHWVFPRIGLTRYWAHHRNLLLNWPALVAWAAGMALALILYLTDTLHLFFLFIPVYLLTVVLYIVLASLAGAKEPHAAATEVETHPGPVTPDHDNAPTVAGRSAPGSMPLWISGGIALAALIVCVAMPLRVFASGPEGYAESMGWLKRWLLVPTLVYFVAGTFWQLRRMERSK